VALCYPTVRTATETVVARASNNDLDADVIVTGAGAIGLSIAWRLSREFRVLLVDPAPGSGASDVAAGMLAPVTELTYGEEALSRLTLASAAAYPAFVEELQAATGMVVGYRQCGTLTVALDRDDLAAVDDMHEFLRARGMRVERLTSHEARRREPLLAPDVHGALLVPGDHQVDPRLLVAALRRACELRGVSEIHAPVAKLALEGGRTAGVFLDDGTELRANRVVIAAGVHSARIVAGVEDIPLRPVKGQLLSLRTPDGTPLLQSIVRGLAHGFAVYLVSRADGRVIVGATVEERGFDTSVTAEAVYTLLRDARRLVPGVSELELLECRAALRPGTPDNAPILGAATTPGLFWATGHYRNGILLAPITADATLALLVHGEMPEIATPFESARFSRGKVRT
jgi:glycine oxidase